MKLISATGPDSDYKLAVIRISGELLTRGISPNNEGSIGALLPGVPDYLLVKTFEQL